MLQQLKVASPATSGRMPTPDLPTSLDPEGTDTSHNPSCNLHFYTNDDNTDLPHPDLSDLVKRVSQNLRQPFIPPSVPRSRTPPPATGGGGVDMVTPTKTPLDLDPLTPTANLKVLISAASPEIRNRERLKELERQKMNVDCEMSNRTNTSTTNTSPPDTSKISDNNKTLKESKDSGETGAHVSRKEKSLGLLCQRFLARYPECPQVFEREEICLDEVAKDLMVERRRIYDIINVLESVELVSRVAKNRYTWHGKTHLRQTLTKLKCLAVQEGFDQQVSNVRSYEMSGRCSPRRAVPPNTVQNNAGLCDYFRKDKSLGIMSQKFLMLFLVSGTAPVNLDLAAKILVGDPSIELTEHSKFKTKIRRLYDIANILTSLDLIRKVHLTENKSRKPAFKYIGPEIEESSHRSPANNTQHADEALIASRPISRHSLLDTLPDAKVFTMRTQTEESEEKRPSPTEKPDNVPQVSLLSQKLSIRRPLTRHSSFDQICEVAEQERNRLYFESKSQPSSPVKQKAKPKRALLPKTKSMPPVSASSSVTSSLSPLPAALDPALKHLVVIRSDRPSPTSHSKPVSIKIQKLPLVKVGGGGGELTRSLFKAQLVKRVDGSGDHQPRIVKVSKGMLDTMLKSMQKSSPLSEEPASRGGGDDGLATPHSSGAHPKTAKRGAQLPQTRPECYFDAKRPRLADPREDSENQPDREVSQLIKAGLKQKLESRATQRVLHLDPEFQPLMLQHEEKTPSPDPGTTPSTLTQDATNHTQRYTAHIPEVHSLLPCTPLAPTTATSNPVTPPTPTTQTSLPITPPTPTTQTSTHVTPPAPTTQTSTPVTVPLSLIPPPGLASSHTPLTPQTPHFSPQTLQIGVSGIGALTAGDIQQTPVCGLITPEETPGFRPVVGGGLQPSAAIINLIPHLTEESSPPDLLPPSRHVPLTVLTHKPRVPSTSTRLCHTQQKQPSLSPVGGLLTPHTHSPHTPSFYTPTTLTPSLTPTTLTPSLTPTTLTPTTYFRSTPGGFYQLATVSTQQLVLGTNMSAFHTMDGTSAPVLPFPSTARRLALIEGDKNNNQ